MFERMPTELGHKPDGMTYGVVVNALAVVSASCDNTGTPDFVFVFFAIVFFFPVHDSAAAYDFRVARTISPSLV